MLMLSRGVQPCTHANSTLRSMRYWLVPLVTGLFLACSACYWHGLLSKSHRSNCFPFLRFVIRKFVVVVVVVVFVVVVNLFQFDFVRS